MLPANAEERRSSRATVFLPAAVECAGVRTDARVINLSAHGVLVLTDCILPEAAPVTFRCHGLIVQGLVSWSDPDGTGINFNEPIEPSRLLRKERSRNNDAGK